MIENALNKIKDIKNNYKNIWKAILQPPKLPVNHYQLGQQYNLIQNTIVTKKSNFLTNSKKIKIGYTFYNVDDKSKKPKKTCLIYLHSHSSNRSEGYNLLNFCVKRKYSLCIFDFQASGESGGNNLTLGPGEAKDTLEIMEMLKKKFKICNFILWGKSMGAVTALIVAQNLGERFCVKGVVLDSPFYCVESFFNGFIHSFLKMPKIFSDFLFKEIVDQCRKKLNLNLKEIQSSDYARNIGNIPIVFVYSSKEKYIKYEDSMKIFGLLKSRKKKLFDCELEHSSYRNEEVIKKIFSLLDSQTTDKRLSKRNSGFFINPKFKKNIKVVKKNKSYKKNKSERENGDIFDKFQKLKSKNSITNFKKSLLQEKDDFISKRHSIFSTKKKKVQKSEQERQMFRDIGNYNQNLSRPQQNLSNGHLFYNNINSKQRFSKNNHSNFKKSKKNDNFFFAAKCEPSVNLSNFNSSKPNFRNISLSSSNKKFNTVHLKNQKSQMNLHNSIRGPSRGILKREKVKSFTNKKQVFFRPRMYSNIKMNEN